MADENPHFAPSPGASGNGEIDAVTQLVGVIGWPVAHSLSPAMHNSVLQGLGLNWRYVPLPVAPGTVEDAVRGMRALGFRGINVTVPHKQAVLGMMDEIAPEAAALGAVNTVVVERKDGGTATLHGYNTDVPGFIGSLEAGGYDPASGRKALVVGAGGASRAVVYGLLRAGVAEVLIFNRTVARAESLATDLHGAGIGNGRLGVRVLDPEALAAEADAADLLVNATTVGMWPHVDESVWPDRIPLPRHLTVYDLVYNPLETGLLRHARRCGAKGIDGLGMLARQGALALALWLEAASPLPGPSCGFAQDKPPWGEGNSLREGEFEGELDVEETTQKMRDVCLRALSARQRTGRQLGTDTKESEGDL